jgi:protein translocase SecG subunit
MFFIVILTAALILVSMFIVMIILMQRPNEETGLGATLGEGSVTAVFGGDAVNVLARWTKWCVGFFYLASFLLAMIYMAREHKAGNPDDILPKKMDMSAQEKSDDSEVVPEGNNGPDGSGAVDDVNANKPEDVVDDLESVLEKDDDSKKGSDEASADSDETPGETSDEVSE